jgi:hypothetical protein
MDTSAANKFLQNSTQTDAHNERDLLQQQATLCISRLERLSADSIWAHRASGVRGALIKSLEELMSTNRDTDQPAAELFGDLKQNLAWGFWLLEQAAREMIS